MDSRWGFVFLACMSAAAAADEPRDGVLDPSYGDGGVALHVSADGGNIVLGELFDAVLQPDGKLLLVGQAQQLNAPTAWRPLPAVVRLNADGSRDTQFGLDGVSVYPLDYDFDDRGGGAKSAVVLEGGRIVVVGGIVSDDFGPYYRRCLLVYALDATGALDPDYGPGPGPTCTDFGDTGIQQNVMLLTGGIADAGDGKVYVAGPGSVAAPRPSVVARLDAAGRFDNSYSSDGRVWLDDDLGFEGYATPVLVTPGDGTLYIATRKIRTQLPPLIGALKLDSNGIAVASFGDAGYAGLTFTTNDVIQTGLAVDGSGAPLVLSYERSLSPLPPGSTPLCNFCVGRFSDTGELSTTFNASGVQPGPPGVARLAIENSEGNGAGLSAQIRPDGRVLLTGNSDGTNQIRQRAMVVSLLPNGSLDPRFGPIDTPGRVTLFPAGGPEIVQLATVSHLLPGARILVAGLYYPDPSSTMPRHMFTVRLQDDALLTDDFENPASTSTAMDASVTRVGS